MMKSRRSKSSSLARFGRSADEDLLHHRLDRLHALAEPGIVDRHVAPAEHRLALRRDDLFDDIAHLLSGLAVARHEELADRVMAGFRQLESELGAFRREERVRDLRQNAATVAKRGIGADRAAMVEIDQNLQALLEDVMRLSVLHVGDEADAAGIVLLRRIVETLGAGSERIDSMRDARACRGGQAFLRLGFGVHFSAPRQSGSFGDCHSNF